MDAPQVIIIVLSALTAIVWVHSWIFDGRDEQGNQREQKTTARLYHGEAMLGVEEF